MSDIVLQDLPEGTKLITEHPQFKAVCLQKSTHFFPSFSFLRVFCSISRYRMKSNTFLPIWSVVSPENNTGIRHFRWESCWSPLSQEKSWNDFTNRTRPRPNLVVFHSVMFQMGVFFAYFENSQKIEVSTKWRNFWGILLSAIKRLIPG